jgi:hypothetical protein
VVVEVVVCNYTLRKRVQADGRPRDRVVVLPTAKAPDVMRMGKKGGLKGCGSPVGIFTKNGNK